MKRRNFTKEQIEKLDTDVRELNESVIDCIQETEDSKTIEFWAKKGKTTRHQINKIRTHKNVGMLPFGYLIDLAKSIFDKGD